MTKIKDIQIKVVGGRKKLIFDGKHTVPIETVKEQNRRPLSNVRDSRVKSKEAMIKRNSIYSEVETLSGGPNSETIKTISGDSLVTILQTTAISQYYELPMGVAGQMRIFIHETGDSSDVRLLCKTRQDDTTTFMSTVDGTSGNKIGKVLMLICDGTYWHPLGNVAAHADFPGEWEIT